MNQAATSNPAEREIWLEQGVLLTRDVDAPSGPLKHLEVTEAGGEGDYAGNAVYSIVTTLAGSWMSRVTCDCDSLPLESDALGPFLTEDEAVRAVADRLLATVSQYIDSANRRLDPWAVANSVEFNRDFDAGGWEGDFDALPDYRATLGWSEGDCGELFRNEFEAFFMGAAVAFKTAEHGLNRHKDAAEQSGGTA